jgi:uncharacterized protein YpbB
MVSFGQKGDLPVEDKQYLTLKEVAELVGVKRTTLYYYIKELEIKTYKFKFDSHAYMSKADAQKIIEIKQKPWELQQEKPIAEAA